MKKILLIGCLLLGSLSILANEPIKVTAVNLYKEYDSNEVKADKKYKGQEIEVTGKVADISKDFLGEIYISISTGAIFSNVMVYFEKSEEDKIAELDKGQNITIVGNGDGMMMGSPIIKKAKIK